MRKCAISERCHSDYHVEKYVPIIITAFKTLWRSFLSRSLSRKTSGNFSPLAAAIVVVVVSEEVPKTRAPLTRVTLRHLFLLEIN